MLEDFNKKRPEKDGIKWCPRCNGIYFFLERNVYSEFDRKEHDVERYTGGLLLVLGTKKKTEGYEFALACDCKCGSIRYEQGKTARYTLIDENRDWCYLQWRQHRIEHRLNEAKGQPVANPVLKALFLRVLGNPTAIVERPKPPEPPEPIEEEPAFEVFDQPEMDL
jgi:hypothetical protein